jgi:hypothetical protein
MLLCPSFLSVTGIAGSNDRIYVWFDDKTVWNGKSRDFTLDGPHPYTRFPEIRTIPGSIEHQFRTATFFRRRG